MTFSSSQKGSLGVPVAIVIAGIIIGGAVLLRGSDSVSAPHGNEERKEHSAIREFSDDDFILGNPNAPVTIVEYSDFECPFCGRVHVTLTELVENRPDDVKWVFRHFPLTQIHSRAQRAAIAGECAGRLGGNDTFWQFADTLFNRQRELGDALYTEEATRLGLDATAFSACLKDPEVREAVMLDFSEAVASGGRGTPHMVVINSRGEQTPLSGALPYETFDHIVNQSL